MNSSGLKGVGLGRANKIFLRNVVHLDKVIIGTIIFYNMFVNHASLRFVYSLTWEARLTIPLNKKWISLYENSLFKATTNGQ